MSTIGNICFKRWKLNVNVALKYMNKIFIYCRLGFQEFSVAEPCPDQESDDNSCKKGYAQLILNTK